MRTLTDVDWNSWVPAERATLLFVIRDGQVLLIHKKKGLGAGKINGPGGRIEAGEEDADAAVREVQEELHITPRGVVHTGTLRFQFTDGFSIECEAFTATDYDGTPTETDEAKPEWFPQDAMPFDRMWADDHVWIPHMLAGRNVSGRFIFDGDTMLDHEVKATG